MTAAKAPSLGILWGTLGSLGVLPGHQAGITHRDARLSEEGTNPPKLPVLGVNSQTPQMSLTSTP